MGADALNACFEFGGAIAVFMSVIALWKAKRWEGLSPWNMIFFNTWGVWNLYFYSHLSQPLSMVAGMCLQAINLTYLFLLWRYRNGTERPASRSARCD